MKFFNNLAIKYKLILIIMLVSIVTLILACFAFTAFDIINYRRIMVNDTSTLGDIIASNSLDQIVNNQSGIDNNPPELKKFSIFSFSLLRAEPQIEFASIINNSGDLVAEYTRSGLKKTIIKPENDFYGSKFVKNNLIIRKAILQDNAKIGTLYILSDTSEIKNHIKQYLFIVLFLISLLIFNALLLSSRLQSLISKPILEIARLAKNVSKGNFDQKADITSNDEFGALAENFNIMISDLRSSRDSLVSAKDYIDNIIKSLIDTLIVTDPEGTINIINNSALELLGYSHDELTGQKISIIFPEEDLPPDERMIDLYIKKGSVSKAEVRYKTKSGEIIPVSISSSVLKNINDEIEGVVFVAQDISEYKRAEKFSKVSRGT